MASERQIAANRLNAQKSTGPKTEAGKRRSRRNAFKHGLTAESVVTVLEDGAAYRKFERILLDDYRPETALERALIARLASLLWRLRRAVAIESGLFEIQGRIVRDRQQANAIHDPDDPLKVFYDLLRGAHANQTGEDIPLAPADGEAAAQQSTRLDLRHLAVAFLRLENHNPGKLDLVGRYETRLWRQLAQTVAILESLYCMSPITRSRIRNHTVRVFPPRL